MARGWAPRPRTARAVGCCCRKRGCRPGRRRCIFRSASCRQPPNRALADSARPLPPRAGRPHNARMALGDSLRLVLAPPHPASRPSLAGGAVAFVLGLVLAHWLAWLALLFLGFCLYFFRDPERVAPARETLLRPRAEGKVVSAAPAAPPTELG